MVPQGGDAVQKVACISRPHGKALSSYDSGIPSVIMPQTPGCCHKAVKGGGGMRRYEWSSASKVEVGSLRSVLVVGHLSPFSLDLQKFISLLMRLPFFLVFSSSPTGSGWVSNFRRLPLDEPGIRRFKLARLARFHA